MLMLLSVLRVLALVMSPPDAWVAERGKASVFLPVERLNNSILACDHGRRWEDENELLVAHRTLPCGTVVIIEHKGKRVAARVLDRGPYGALDADGKWLVKRPLDPVTRDAVWRGIVDLSPGVAKAVGLRSMGMVTVWTLKRKLAQRAASPEEASPNTARRASGAWPGRGGRSRAPGPRGSNVARSGMSHANTRCVDAGPGASDAQRRSAL